MVLSLLSTMPLSRQPKDLEEILLTIQERLSAIQAQMETTETRQTNIEANKEFLQTTLTSLVNQVSPNFPSTFSPHMSTQDQPHISPTIRPPKLQLAFFEGPNPLDWLFQAEQYFTFYQISLDQRLSMVPFHMKGDALSWFKWMHQNNLLADWPSFTRVLKLRFGLSSYTNHQAELFKLHQHSSVSEYQARFEKICNCVQGLSPETILNCFTSGLHPEIRRELAILNPYSISHAIGLAKLIEDKIRDSKPKLFCSPNLTNFQHHTTNNLRHPHLPPTTTITQTNLNHPVVPHNLPPLTYQLNVSHAQLQERRALGLCYNCDEIFYPGNKCSSSRFLLLLDNLD